MTNLASNNIWLTLIASFAIFAAVAGASTGALAADSAPSSVTAHATPATGPDTRIRHLHNLLKITATQEAHWHNVAQRMLDDASAIDSIIKDRVRMNKGMAAIDDLQSYEAIVDAHAQGIKKLAITLKPPYASPEELLESRLEMS